MSVSAGKDKTALMRGLADDKLYQFDVTIKNWVLVPTPNTVSDMVTIQDTYYYMDAENKLFESN